eukprot:jgi/Undpi1/8718/HiC_scaffold_25.g11183.m1
MPALVDAGKRTWVDVDATGYDKRDADDGGCDPKGCVPENTRDGSRKANSRWSCEGDGCCITYYFEEPQDIVSMKIAFHKGDERTRKLDVYETYDDGKNKSQIKSSGKTLGYETFYLNTDETEKIKLCLDGDDDEWLSITELTPEQPRNESQYLLPDSITMRSFAIILAILLAATVGTTSALVDAGKRTWVDVDATGYDKRDADDGGCDPKGCVPENTRDGSRKANSRWSCEGDGCCITYYFEEPQDIVSMKIAFHKGDERTRKLDVYETYDDGKHHTEIKSSGETVGYETFYLNTDETEKMKLCLDGDDDEWLSITERPRTPIRLLEFKRHIDNVVGLLERAALVDAGKRTWVDVDATGYDKRDADDGGCDPKGCKPENTRDGSRKANSRWSCEGDGCCITYSFEEPQDIVSMKIAFHKGDERTRKLDVYETYDDGKNKSQIKSSGKTLGYETFYLNTDETEKMKLCLDGDDDEWLSITEVKFMVK